MNFRHAEVMRRLIELIAASQRSRLYRIAIADALIFPEAPQERYRNAHARVFYHCRHYQPEIPLVGSARDVELDD